MQVQHVLGWTCVSKAVGEHGQDYVSGKAFAGPDLQGYFPAQLGLWQDARVATIGGGVWLKYGAWRIGLVLWVLSVTKDGRNTGGGGTW